MAQNSVGLLEPHCWHLPTLGARVLLCFAVDNELLALLCLGQVPQGVFCSDSAFKVVVSPEGTKENSQKERIPTIFQVLAKYSAVHIEFFSHLRNKELFLLQRTTPRLKGVK